MEKALIFRRENPWEQGAMIGKFTWEINLKPRLARFHACRMRRACPASALPPSRSRNIDRLPYRNTMRLTADQLHEGTQVPGPAHGERRNRS